MDAVWTAAAAGAAGAATAAAAPAAAAVTVLTALQVSFLALAAVMVRYTADGGGTVCFSGHHPQLTTAAAFLRISNTGINKICRQVVSMMNGMVKTSLLHWDLWQLCTVYCIDLFGKYLILKRQPTKLPSSLKTL